jgi:PKD repeat protein
MKSRFIPTILHLHNLKIHFMKKIIQFVFVLALLCSTALQAVAQPNPCAGLIPAYPVVYMTDNSPATMTGQWVPNNAAYPLTYSWVFDDGFTSTAEQITHVFATGGMHNVVCQLTDANGCSVTRTEVLDFNNTCTAEFTTSGTNIIDFDGYASSGYYGQSTWTFGDGSSVVNSTMMRRHYYPNPGTYNVCLNISYAQNGCNSTTCHPVTITNRSCGLLGFGELIAGDLMSATLAENNTVAFAVSPVSFNNTPLINLQTTWDFGDSSAVQTVNGTNISHQFADGGTKTVCVTATAQIAGTTQTCSDSYCRTFNINNCGFNPFTFQGFQNNPTHVIFSNDNASSGCGGSVQRWDFGDGTPTLDTFGVGLPLLHVYPDTGSYTVCLSMSSPSCQNIDCQTVHVGANAQPCSLAIINVGTDPQSDGSYSVYVSEYGGSVGTPTYAWNNGQTDNFANYTGGIYTVTITDITGCTAVASDTLPGCHTSFLPYNLNGFTPNVFSFQNQSSQFTNYTWDFGDNTSSTERNPVHTYAQSGTYIVCLSTVNLPLYPCDPVLGQPNPCPPSECVSGQYCDTVSVNMNNDCIANKCVFPGDTNYDGVANMYDLLPIGAAYNAWGVARQNQDGIWYPHYANNWQQAFTTAGLNYKQIDCDGNGYITTQDVDAINTNYGRTHNNLVPTNRAVSAAAVPMFLTHTIDTLFTAANTGGTLYSDIMIGTPTQTANFAYGAAMRIEYPAGMVDATQPIEVMWDTNSWLANNTQTISIVHDDRANGILDIAISRTNQQNITAGQGKVGRIKWVITDNINGRPAAKSSIATPFTTVVTEGALVNKTLLPKTVQGQGSSIVIVSSGTVATENEAWKATVRIFPNPTSNGKLNIVSNDITIENLALNDVLGRNVLEMRNINANTQQLDTANLSAGVYLLTVQTAKGIMTERVVIR